jgi:protein-S-isoprenylcysteine O-methyltransferase Ste14
MHLIFVKEYSENKPYLFFRAIIRNASALFHKDKNYSIEKEEKVALLFILVKLFFLPTMVNFFYNNLWGLLNGQSNFQWYPFFLTFLFTIDTLIFTIGYMFESPKLRNVVKSVEPTFFGWFVALICYPPFNSIVGSYVPWGANDQVLFWTSGWTLFFRIIMILLLVIYVWASLALGLKSSNLTNRGIVTRFPYSIVRHPAYISKNLIWWLSMLPVMNLAFFLGMSFWTIIYFLRAWTEERHLKQDPDYLKYCEKVKWRFIPRLI